MPASKFLMRGCCGRKLGSHLRFGKDVRDIFGVVNAQRIGIGLDQVWAELYDNLTCDRPFTLACDHPFFDECVGCDGIVSLAILRSELRWFERALDALEPQVCDLGATRINMRRCIIIYRRTVFLGTGVHWLSYWSLAKVGECPRSAACPRSALH